MWISTLENTFDTDHFANFAIVEGKVSKGKRTFAVHGFYALRDGSVHSSIAVCMRNAYDFKGLLTICLRNGNDSALEKFLREERDKQYDKDDVSKPMGRHKPIGRPLRCVVGAFTAFFA